VDENEDEIKWAEEEEEKDCGGSWKTFLNINWDHEPRSPHPAFGHPLPIGWGEGK
jgi:hypothetical protein